MTVTTWALSPAGESQSAEKLKRLLLDSEPQLDHPEISLDIVSDIYLPERQIDLVILYEDKRSADKLLRTDDGTQIHSFVMIIEIKNHSPDNVRFRGTNLSVLYDGHWKDATYQCDQQTYAFKNFQSASLIGDQKLRPVFVQRAIWLTRTPRNSIAQPPTPSSVPVLYGGVSWADLARELSHPTKDTSRPFQAFFPSEKYHSQETLKSKLTREVVPTKLDLRRINILTEKRRFTDQKYVQNLGEQLLIFKGRGGTGKTVTMIKLAIFLARQNKKCVLVTYNHGLISDVSRLLYLASRKDLTLKVPPKIQTRYSFIQDTFIREFGQHAEDGLIRNFIRDGIDALEETRLHRLLSIERINPEYDFALIDEGQDWQPEQRDLIYKMFGPGRVVVADGVDQFVGKDRCSWDSEEVTEKQTVPLKSSLRTKGATCHVVGEIARELGVKGWDLEPDPEVYGGRLTVFVEPHARSAVSQSLKLIDEDVRRSDGICPSDNLICMPSSKMSGGMNYEYLFDQAINDQKLNSWRGFDKVDRRQYVYDPSQQKAVLYNSCRGMEGWTTICLGLDRFFDFQIRNPRIDRETLQRELQAQDTLFSKSNVDDEFNKRALEYAVNWIMIPLTRSIDHLVIHVSDENSRLAGILKSVSKQNPNTIEWLYGKSPLAGN